MPFNIVEFTSNLADVVGKAIVEILHVFLLLVSAQLDLADSGCRLVGVRSLGERRVHDVAANHSPSDLARTGSGAQRPAARPRDDETARRCCSLRPERRLGCRDVPFIGCLLLGHRRRRRECSASAVCSSSSASAAGSTVGVPWPVAPAALR